MLLFRLSRLWYCPLFRTNNTEPTPYVHIHENVYKIHTNEHLCVALFWNM